MIQQTESTPPTLPPVAASEEAARGLEVVAYGISKAFGDKTVLRNLNLSVEAGEFVVIIGRSGCGKSTLLRLLAGLDAPDQGLVLFGQEGRVRQPGDIRVMYQEPRLLPWATIVENVAIGLGEAETGVARREKALATLAAVGLADRAVEWPSVLSGGQKQRVALARALVSHPGVLALDEPLGALDALTRIDMQGLLEAIWRDQGLTALMVTHDVPEAITLADRIVLVEEGRIVLDQRVDLPRPRERGTPSFAALEHTILARLMRTGHPSSRQE
jgi:sulfonate transport system ATP-binding protein